MKWGFTSPSEFDRKGRPMQSREIASFWRFITSAIDRLIVCLDGLDQTELDWRPLPDANSLYVLAVHTLANTEENILVHLGVSKTVNQ